MFNLMDPFDYETGTTIQSFNILEINPHTGGYEVILTIDLDSGYELENVKMILSFEDLAACETKDVHEGMKYALGFFHKN